MREKLREFVELLIRNEKIEKKYYELLGDLDIYDTSWEAEQMIADILGIPEFVMDYIIRDYAYWVAHDKPANMVVHDGNNNLITDMDALLDYAMREWEEDFKNV